MSIVTRGLSGGGSGSMVSAGLTIRSRISIAQAGIACLVIAAATTVIVMVC